MPFKVEAYQNSEFIIESGMQIDTHPLLINAKRINVPRVHYGAGGTAVGYVSFLW